MNLRSLVSHYVCNFQKIATKGAEGLKILSNRASEAVTKRKAKLEKKKAAYLEELPSAVVAIEFKAYIIIIHICS